MSGPAPALAKKSQRTNGAGPVPKTQQKFRSVPTVEAVKNSIGNQAAIALASQSAEREAKVATPAKSGILQVSAFLELSKGPREFAIYRWELVPAADVSLERAEREVLDGVMKKALSEARLRQRHKFFGTLIAKHLQIDLSINALDLIEGAQRELLVSRVAYLVTDKIKTTRLIEYELLRRNRSQFRHAETPGISADEQLRREIATMRGEIADIRHEMREGMVAQGKAQTKLARFTAFVSISPPPDDSGWMRPEVYLKSVEEALDNNAPRDAEMFMVVARGSLHDHQAWWNRYKRDLEFGDEVVGPVFWQFLELASLGVVDEEVFDRAERESKIDHGHGEWLMEVRFWILFACEQILDRIGNVVTLGAYHGWKEGVEQRIKANPDDPLWEIMLYAGPDAAKGVAKTIAPVEEAVTLWRGAKKLATGQDTYDEKSGQLLTPDVWAALSAFSNALLKLALLGKAAKDIKSRGKAKKALEEKALEEKARNDAVAKEKAAQERAGSAGGKQAQPLEKAAEQQRGKPGALDAPTLESPQPNVLLRGVSIARFESLLAELERSTEAGREAARKVRNGEIEITLDIEGIGKGAQGRAIPNQVHIKWGANLRETASTVIHEIAHALDPKLKEGPRVQVEANARLSEFEYRSKRGLQPKDATERAYRKSVEDARAQGVDPAAAAEAARKSMADAMQRDPKRYGLEPQKGAKQLEPAKSPTTEPKPAEGKKAADGKTKSKKPGVLTDAMRELKANERSVPKELLEQLKKVKVMPDYLYRQLLAGGARLVKLFLESNEKKRRLMKAWLKMRDDSEIAQRKDTAKAFDIDYFEENIPNRKPSVKELTRDPATGEILEAFEKPQGTFERGEARNIGVLEEVVEILEKVPELNKQGYDTILLKTQFGSLPWLKKIFFGNEKPDMVAVGKGKILVGDPTTRLNNPITVKNTPGAKELHFEKTSRHAQRLYEAIKDNPEFKGYEVYAVDYLRSTWDQMTPKLIGKVP